MNVGAKEMKGARKANRSAEDIQWARSVFGYRDEKSKKRSMEEVVMRLARTVNRRDRETK